MDLKLPSQINRRKWLLALGVPLANPDPALISTLDKIQEKLLVWAKPKATHKTVDLTQVKAALLHGEGITDHLKNCPRLVILAITLGIDIDNQLRKLQVQNMADAVLFDTGASVLVEELWNEYARAVASSASEYYTLPFSPGYGDFPLNVQSPLTRLLDCQRQIGLTVTPTHLLVPRKSITGIVGLSEHPVTSKLATCHICQIKDRCQLYKIGRTCSE